VIDKINAALAALEGITALRVNIQVFLPDGDSATWAQIRETYDCKVEFQCWAGNTVRSVCEVANIRFGEVVSLTVFHGRSPTPTECDRHEDRKCGCWKPARSGG
jgi:hypothetical protein